MDKVGSFKNPVTAKDGALHAMLPENGTVWVHTANGHLLGIDNYGSVLEVVVYGQNPIKIRRAGSPLESAIIYHPGTNRTRSAATARG